jgi:hypothetical protein
MGGLILLTLFTKNTIPSSIIIENFDIVHDVLTIHIGTTYTDISHYSYWCQFLPMKTR